MMKMVNRPRIRVLFQSDPPFPAAEWPEMKNNNRRYFYYRALAKKLGATGRHTRAKLPVAACLVKRIAQMYPDARGAATKVRFRKRAREEEGGKQLLPVHSAWFTPLIGL